MKPVIANGLETNRVLFDTCFIIACLANVKSSMSQILFAILQSGYIPIVTSTIVNELDRKRWKVSRNLDAENCAKWFEFLWRRLIVVDDRDSRITSASINIPTHFPDNLHIAAAKFQKAIIISLDKKLIRTATDEGIPAFDPPSFLRGLSDQAKDRGLCN